MWALVLCFSTTAALLSQLYYRELLSYGLLVCKYRLFRVRRVSKTLCTSSWLVLLIVYQANASRGVPKGQENLYKVPLFGIRLMLSAGEIAKHTIIQS